MRERYSHGEKTPERCFREADRQKSKVIGIKRNVLSDDFSPSRQARITIAEVSMYLIICFLRARSRMCGRYLRSQLVHMTNIRVYNNSVGLQTLKLPLKSSQTVTNTAIGTLPGYMYTIQH